MVEYTIDDIRGPTVAREMAQLKEFVLAKFNGAIADAEAAAAAAATAAANAVLANTVKKTGEASQSIAGNVGITGTLDAAAIGSGSTPITCGDLTAFGNVSLDDTALQGNLSATDANALINLSGVGSVLVPTPTANGEAATKKYVDDALDNYAPMVRNTGNIKISGSKQFQDAISRGCTSADMMANPTTNVGATVLSLVDLMQGDTHNSIGSMTKVRNAAAQNYFDIQSTSYGYTEGGVQQRMDIFLRLLINDSTGDAQLILYRSKRNADGTGATDIKSKVLAQITAAGVIT